MNDQDALPQVLGASVERPIGRDASHVQVEVVLPGETDATVDLKAALREGGRPLVDEHLRHSGDLLGMRGCIPYGPEGRRSQRSRSLQCHAQIRQQVLDRLKRPNRTAESHPVKGIQSSHFEQRVHGSDGFGRGQSRAERAGVGQVGIGKVGPFQRVDFHAS